MLENEGDREAQRRIKWVRQERARTLYLGNMKLRTLPEAIASLTQLRTLYLDPNLGQIRLDRLQMRMWETTIAEILRLID